MRTGEGQPNSWRLDTNRPRQSDFRPSSLPRHPSIHPWLAALCFSSIYSLYSFRPLDTSVKQGVAPCSASPFTCYCPLIPHILSCYKKQRESRPSFISAWITYIHTYIALVRWWSDLMQVGYGEGSVRDSVLILEKHWFPHSGPGYGDRSQLRYLKEPLQLVSNVSSQLYKN